MQDLHEQATMGALKAQVVALQNESTNHFAEMIRWRQEFEMVSCMMTTLSHTRFWRWARTLRSFRRLLWPRKIDVDAIIPWQHLEPKPKENTAWQVKNEEAYFLIPCMLPACWLRVSLKLSGNPKGRMVLYADSGTGYKQVASADWAEGQGTVHKELYLHFQTPLKALRLDPMDRTGEFRIDELRITPVPRLVTMMRNVLGRLRTARSHFTGLAMKRAFGMLIRGEFGKLTNKLAKRCHALSNDHNGLTIAAGVYDSWRKSHRLTDNDRSRMKAEIASMFKPPKISVLMPVYNVPEEYLRAAIESVLRQVYPHWELCIADDCSPAPHIRQVLDEYAQRDRRIKVTYRDKNGNISAASNSALELVTGDYVALLDHDDEMAEQALYRMAQAIVADRRVDMLYSDEDKLEIDGRFVDPFFKPDWSPEYFLACMYTCHLGVYRTELVRDIGGFRSEFDTAQDYDLVLRIMARTSQIKHVPEVLYHWRKLPTSTAQDSSAKPQASSAARRAIASYLEEIGRPGTVEPSPSSPDFNRVRFQLQGRPKVSIIIGSACKPVMLRGENTYYAQKCVESIRSKSTYDNYEIILISNQLIAPELQSRLDAMQVKTVLNMVPFNWSATQNLGVENATGDYYLFMNDDMEVITPDWLESMLEFAQVPEIGAVGVKLLYPDGRLQHAGVIIVDTNPTHAFHQYPGDHPGYYFGSVLHRNFSAVTGACLMTRKDVFEDIGGFDIGFPLEFNDVDYCLKIISSGRRIVNVPDAQLYHYESVTRTNGMLLSLKRFKERWAKKWALDPYYNPNLSLGHSDYRIAMEKAA